VSIYKKTLIVVSYILVTGINSVRAIEGEIFDDIYSCHYQWKELVRSWRKNGGSFGSSLEDVRLNIKSDNVSEFAKIIKRVWENQRTTQGRTKTIIFGQWPVDDYIRVVQFPKQSNIKSLEQKCQTFVWLNALIWDELRSSNNSKTEPIRFKEVPARMEWSSPDAQYWTIYWLLKNQ